MICITGDTHGLNDTRKLETNKTLAGLSKEDYLIIAGDFGGVWDGTWHDDAVLNFYAHQPYTTLFIDGNHENFDLLNKFPVRTWNGGKVHRVSDRVYHLMRGQIFNIDGLNIFTFGGAVSIDRSFRTPGVDWWPEELPSEEECSEALENLEEHGYLVDYVISHAAPESVVRDSLSAEHRIQCLDSKAEKFLDTVLKKTVYRRWYCGHYHFDMDVKDQRLSVLYQRTVELRSGDRVR